MTHVRTYPKLLTMMRFVRKTKHYSREVYHMSCLITVLGWWEGNFTTCRCIWEGYEYDYLVGIGYPVSTKKLNKLTHI